MKLFINSNLFLFMCEFAIKKKTLKIILSVDYFNC